MSTKLPHATVPARPQWQPGLQPPGWPVRGLIFDTGDVLYDATGWRRWLLMVLARLGLATHYASFYRIWDRDFLADVHCGRREFWEAFRAFLLSAGLSHGQVEEVEVACRARRRRWLAAARPFPGVRAALGRLSEAGVPLAAICDSELPREALREQFRRFGLDEAFAAMVCSRELKRTKPDEACYRAALAALCLPAERAAFVGHDTRELAAAARLGLQTVAFNYDPDAQADVYLGRFDELVEQILPRRPFAAAG